MGRAHGSYSSHATANRCRRPFGEHRHRGNGAVAYPTRRRVDRLAAPEHDRGAIEMDVRKAIELGRARARASAEARVRKAQAKD